MVSSDTPPELDIDVGECRGIVWAGKCAEALNENKDGEVLDNLRKCVRHFKRKGGDGGKPGDYDELFGKLLKASGFDEEDEEGCNSLKELLEGEDEDAWE